MNNVINVYTMNFELKRRLISDVTRMICVRIYMKGGNKSLSIKRNVKRGKEEDGFLCKIIFTLSIAQINSIFKCFKGCPSCFP